MQFFKFAFSLILFFFASPNIIFAQFDANPDYKYFEVDIPALYDGSKNAPPILSGLARDEKPIIELPTPNGILKSFHIEESSVFEPALAAQYPEIKSYVIQGVEDPTITGRFNLTPLGYYAIIRDQNGIGIVEPEDRLNPSGQYQGYYESRADFECNSQISELNLEDIRSNEGESFRTNSCFQNGATLRTFRIAVTCTWEYANLQGFTLAGVNSAIANRLAAANAVYENEMAIHFDLASNNNLLINDILGSTQTTDPFTNPSNTGTSLANTETHITSLLANSDYDFGHGYHEVACPPTCSVGGLAGVGVICDNSRKAEAYSTFFQGGGVTLYLHEMGHQFSCYHTNYGCGTNNQCERYEPGQGSTIMSTSAGCSANDFFEGRSDYFNIGSLQSILDFVTSGIVSNNNSSCNTSTTAHGMCAATSASGNTPPTSNANPNSGSYTIPGLTPFQLEGEGSDPDGDVLTYNWEQYDTDYSGSIIPDNAGSGGTTTDQLFRSFPPSTNPTRVCPQLSSILAGNVTAGTGEDLPDENRTMTWRLIVRDNHVGAGGIACDEIAITVDASAGPFEITTQNSATSWTANGSNTATINWNVAGTNVGAVSCSNVDILFSTDGGMTFPYTLATGTANDGSHIITIPSYATSVGRIKVICSDNIFFDINNADIEINSSCLANGATFSPDTPVSAPVGDPSLNLGLSTNFSNQVTFPFSSTIDGTETPTSGSNASFECTTSSCTNFGGWTFNYDNYDIYASVAGTYTFSISSNFSAALQIFEGPFDVNAGCTNLLGISRCHNAPNIITGTVNTVTVTLTPGIMYSLAVSNFFFGTQTGNYTISLNSAPAGASLYDGPNVPPGTGFSYTYVVVNTATNLIAGFESSSDLTAYAAGTYKAYGISYESIANLNPYIGSSFTSFQTDLAFLVVCGNLSTNCIEVDITGSSSCDPNYAGGNALSGNQTANDDFETDGIIESSQNVSAPMVDYDSGTYICLKNGFEVQLGTVFRAFIDGCGGAMLTGDDDNALLEEGGTETSDKESKKE